MFRYVSVLLLAAAIAVPLAADIGGQAQAPPREPAPAQPVVRSELPHAAPVRLTGIVEAEQAAAIVMPRLHGGRGGGDMVLMSLVPGGTRVGKDQVLIEIDPQDQVRQAFEQRVSLSDLEGQIGRTIATQAVSRSQDDTAITVAENDVARAKLEVTKNELIPKVEAEKNSLALEQAEARLKQLRETYGLKRTAALADMRILEIRRDRARQALEHAEGNADLMTIRAPFDGLVVLKTTFRAGTMTEYQEGDQVRPGQAVLDVIDPNRMRVRAQINQADITRVSVGQPASIGLDAYPGLAFDGVVEQIAPLATPSQRNPRVRTFTCVVSVRGSHPNLLPDLTASVELLPGTVR
ncbi:MAG: HlyD family efflux transporter periplasmic adaptor subunit [Vicinamibacterales bacterium]